MAWPGLDAGSFLEPDQAFTPSRPSRFEWGFAGGKFALGAAILFGLARIVPAEDLYYVGWIGMIGIVLMLTHPLVDSVESAWRK